MCKACYCNTLTCDLGTEIEIKAGTLFFQCYGLGRANLRTLHKASDCIAEWDHVIDALVIATMATALTSNVSMNLI